MACAALRPGYDIRASLCNRYFEGVCTSIRDCKVTADLTSSIEDMKAEFSSAIKQLKADFDLEKTARAAEVAALKAAIADSPVPPQIPDLPSALPDIESASPPPSLSPPPPPPSPPPSSPAPPPPRAPAATGEMSDPAASSAEITALWDMVSELQQKLTDGMTSLQAALDAETAARIAEDNRDDAQDST